MLHNYTHVIKLHKVITVIQMLHIFSRKVVICKLEIKICFEIENINQSAAIMVKIHVTFFLQKMKIYSCLLKD